MLEKVLLAGVDLGTLNGDLWFGFFLLIAIFIFSWSKAKIGDLTAAIIFTVAIMMIVFYGHPDLLWLALGIYLFSVYGKEMFKG